MARTSRDLAPGAVAPVARVEGSTRRYSAQCGLCYAVCGHTHRSARRAAECVAGLCGCTRTGPAWGSYPGERT